MKPVSPGGRLFRSLATGARQAGARPGLIGAIWLWHLVLGLTLAVPFFTWLYDATVYRPAADVLAHRFSFGLLAELQQYDSRGMLAIVSAGAAAGLLVATLTSPLVVAATLASLRNRMLSAGELGSVAVSLYWPCLRVIVFGRLAALAAAVAVAVSLRPIVRPLAESSWEAGRLWALGIRGAAAALVAVLLVAAVDFALVRLEEQRSRKGFQAWVAGLRFVGSHAVLTLGLWIGFAAMLAAAITVFVGLREATGAVSTSLPTALAVTVAIVLQQLFMLTRTGLRVGLLGAEQHAFPLAATVGISTAGHTPEPETLRVHDVPTGEPRSARVRG